jgi:hypothetical protein
MGAITVLGGCTQNKDTKGLWIANHNTVVEYIPKQISGASTTATPHLVNQSTFFGSPQGVTFDSSGNLWVVDPIANVNNGTAPALLEFSANQIGALGTTPAPDPVVVITSSSLAFPQQSAFDAHGNQWVTDHDNNTVLVFSSAQLALSGTNNLTPAITVTSTSFDGPLGIAFDGGGNLWVANNGSVTDPTTGITGAAGTTIVKFASGSLPVVSADAETSDLTPTVTLSDDGSESIQSPWALTFDQKGNLLVSNAGVNTVIEIPSGSLSATSAPNPSLTLASTSVGGNPSIETPNGICLDNADELAVVSSAGVFGVAFYTTPLPSGAATPATFIGPGVTSTSSGTTLDVPEGCVFGPAID